MTPERWHAIKQTIRREYPVEDEGTEDLLVATGEGIVKQGESEFIIFASPLGRMKLEFQKKPKVEAKKYHYSHRQGDAARVEYKFSENLEVYTLKAYKWDEAEEVWREIDASTFG